MRRGGIKSKTASSFPKVPADIVEYLEKTYPPRSITVGQSEIEAHRYAAKVELAQNLIAMAKRGTPEADHEVEI